MFKAMMASGESTESLEGIQNKYESNRTLLVINKDNDTYMHYEVGIGKQATTSTDFSNEIIETKESDVRDSPSLAIMPIIQRSLYNAWQC